ncbi:hypothetical protein HRbin26_01716 [bacterium HR26]|nr:hypothetical protein HRbin26_01716 [bacterium HR26]
MGTRRLSWPLALLALLAALASANAGVAAGRWLDVWRAFDNLRITLTGIEVADDESAVLVRLRLENGSGRTLRLSFARAGLWLNGRSLTAGEVSLGQVELPPGGRYDLELRANVYAELRDYLRRERESGRLSWRVEGEVRLRVGELTDWVLVPYWAVWETGA